MQSLPQDKSQPKINVQELLEQSDQAIAEAQRQIAVYQNMVDIRLMGK